VGIEVDDPGVLIDVDTEADLDAVRSAQQRGEEAPQRL
jgi:CTP:molybdopterin cytidylyltransferase MocA